MYILSIDTGTKNLIVSIGSADKYIDGIFINSGRTHSKHIISEIDKLLEQANLTLADIDYFAASEGPGSFTGLRIGISTVQGFAFANNKPCLKVNTLDAFARDNLSKNTLTLALMDARNRRVYAAAYFANDILVPASVGDVEDFIKQVKLALEESQYQVEKIIFAGDESRVIYSSDEDVLNLLPDSSIEVAEAYYKAEVLHRLAYEELEAGRTISAEELLPEYYSLTEAERNLETQNE